MRIRVKTNRAGFLCRYSTKNNEARAFFFRGHPTATTAPYPASLYP